MRGEEELKTCFVICPIGDAGTPIRKRSNEVLEYIITPAVTECGYDIPVRADRMAQPGNISLKVIQHVIDADLVVADLTGHNANVFYELAIRHAVAKPVVMVMEGETLPFDISHDRVIYFVHEDLTSVNTCKEEIVKQIRFIEENPGKVDSPVSMAINIPLLRQSDEFQQKSADMIVEIFEEIKSVVTAIPRRQDPVRPLADMKTIRTFITGSGDFAPAKESPDTAEVLLLFSTNRQQTWLVATSQRLYCILDDIREYEPDLRWSIAKEDLVQEDKVAVKITVRSKTIDISDQHRQWYYSSGLFRNIDVATAIKQIIERKMIKVGK